MIAATVMFYDLNVEHNASRAATPDGELPKTLSFLAECEHLSVTASHVQVLMEC